MSVELTVTRSGDVITIYPKRRVLREVVALLRQMPGLELADWTFQAKQSCSFSKKRIKKLWLMWRALSDRSVTTFKSLLLLFFRKEDLPSLAAQLA